MPKGQCWSIADNNSKFVLQTRRPNYWRIELPVESQMDLQKAQELRDVLDSVLQFEKTPCPFERNFTVQLPQTSTEPVRRKAWAPSPGSVSVDYSKAIELPAVPIKVIDSRPRSAQKTTIGDHKDTPSSDEALSENVENLSKEHFNGTERISVKSLPITSTETLRNVRIPFGPRKAGHEQRATGACSSNNLDMEPRVLREETLLNGPEDLAIAANVIKAKPARRHTGFGALRSAPSAPQLTLLASPPSKEVLRCAVIGAERTLEESGRVSPANSQSSFYSTRSWLSPTASLPPSPSCASLENDSASFSYDDAASPAAEDAESQSPPCPSTPRTGTAISYSTESLESTPRPCDMPSNFMRHSGRYDAGNDIFEANATSHQTCCTARGESYPSSRDQTTLRRRALSPLPPAVTLIHPTNDGVTPISSPLKLRKLPIALLTKSCGLLLRPPSFLIALMLRVAARISAGEWKGTAMGYDPTGDQIPVDWGYSDSEWEDDLDIDQDELEVFPSPVPPSSQNCKTPDDSDGEGFEDASQSWEAG